MYRLTAEQQEIVTRTRAIAESVIARHAAEVDTQGRFPSESMKALGDAGLWGLLIPQEFGGLGQGLRVLAAAVDEIAQQCASTAMVFMMHHSGVNCLLAEPVKFGPLLREIAAGKRLSTLAFSEKGSRSQFWAPVSKATGGNGPVKLSAEKSWVTSAGVADLVIASCLSEAGPGPSVYLVRLDDPGVSVSGGWDSLGMRGNQSNPMTFKDVPLNPAERLIGTDGKGDEIMLGKALPVFQICQGAIGAGIAEAAFAAAQKHITGHGFLHTGTRLSDLPNLRAELATMRLETDKARAYLVATLDKLESGAADGMLHMLAVKGSSSEAAVRVTDLGMRACGGAAFSKHLGLERAFRDARAAIVMAPTTDHLLEFTGRILVGLPLFG